MIQVNGYAEDTDDVMCDVDPYEPPVPEDEDSLSTTAMAGSPNNHDSSDPLNQVQESLCQHFDSTLYEISAAATPLYKGSAVTA